MSDNPFSQTSSDSSQFHKELNDIINRPMPVEPPPKRGLIADAATHFAIGANKYAAMPIAGLTEMAGRATGIKPLEDLGKTVGDNAEAWIARKEQESPSQKFRDIAGPGDAARWAGEQLMEFAPQAVIGLATGGAGAAAGRVAAGGLVRGGLATAEGIAGKKAVQAAVANQGGRALAGEEIAALAANRASTAGAIAATGAGSVGMETSSIYRDQKDGEKDMGRAALYGTAAGILDTAFPAWLMSKTGLTKLMPGMGAISREADAVAARPALSIGQKVKDTAKIAGIGIAEETPQEGVQTVLENIGANKQVYSDEVRKAGGDFSAFLKVAASKGISAAVHPEAWNDIVESMAAGGLIGGVMGGGSAGAGHIADSLSSRPNQQQSDVATGTPPAGSLEAGGAPPPAVPPAATSTSPGAIPGVMQDAGGEIPDFTPSPMPTGTLGKALAIAGIPTEPAAQSMYTQFAANPFAAAPQQASAIAGPQVTGLLAQMQSKPDELTAAQQWAVEQIKAGRTELMQNRGVSNEQQAAKILKAYRDSQEVTNATPDILPALPPTNGPGQVDRPGMGMSPLSAEVPGGGSGVTQSSSTGTAVERSRITLLQEEKEQLLADPRNRGIAGDAIYSPETTRRLNEINVELRTLATPAATLDVNAHAAATSPHNDIPEPTTAQIEAGNYKKGHVSLHGLDISIENPAGSTRKGVDETGRQWSTDLIHHYGYIKGTIGKDKDHVDVFVKPGVDQTTVGDRIFVVDQKNTKTGRFDEHKVMMGYATPAEARQAYLDNYDKTGPERILNIAETTADDFNGWLKDGDQNKPFIKVTKVTSVAKPENPRRQLDSTKDSLIVAAAKLGGISRSDIERESVSGRDLTATLNKLATKEARAGLLHVISAKGRPLDRMREALMQQGYLPEDSSVNDLLDKLDSSSRGIIHRSTFSEASGEDEYQSEVDRYSAMIEAMTEEEHAEFGKNQWLDEQADLLAEVSDLQDAWLDELDAGNMTAADWQAVETEFKEALDEEISGTGVVEENQGKSGQAATGTAAVIPEVSTGDDAEQTAAAPESTSQVTGQGSANSVEQAEEPALQNSPDNLETVDAPPAPDRTSSTSDKAKIEDFGEKIGGARKDTAERGPARPRAVKPADDEPAWKKRFKVMESVRVPGTFSIIDTKAGRYSFSSRLQTFDSEKAAEQAIPLYAVAVAHQIMQKGDGGWEIFKRIGERKRLKVVNQEFTSREEAMQYMALNAEKLLESKTTFGEEILPVPEIAVRTGVQRRSKPATPQMFMETFAPRGIEFGNWNNQEERQQVMDHAYDGLLDLAEVLNVPPKALMLDGDLAIAFGARGQGLSGAKAHYERDFGVINLTKMKGAGSLAHEWFHALDHYLGRQDSKASSEKELNKAGNPVYKTKGTSDYLSQGISYKSKVRPEIQEAYKQLIQGMFRKGQQYVEDTQKADTFVGTARDNLQSSLDDIRKNLAEDLAERYTWRKVKRGLYPATAGQLMEFDRLATVLVEGGDLETKWQANNPDAPARSRVGMSGRRTNDTLEGISRILKAVRGSSGFTTDGKGTLDRLRSAMGLYETRLNMLKDAASQTEKIKQVPTSFAMEARKMDQARTSDYWSEPHEMAARAFAAYVEDKVAAQGGQSDFIVYHAHGGILVPMIDGFIARPYPEGKEREAINAAFDDFTSRLQTRETEKGTALFALAPENERDIIKSRSDKIKGGFYVHERLPERYERAGQEGTLGAATAHARGIHEAVRRGEISGGDAWERHQRYKELAANHLRPQEAAALRQWAAANNLLFDTAEFDRQWKRDGKKGGAEHQVYISADGTRVFKRNKLNLAFHETYLDYFQRLAVHNTEFEGAKYTLEGFVESDGVLMPVVSQPAVKGRKTTFEESHGEMIKSGYEPIGSGPHPSSYRIPGTGLIVRDVHGDNSRIDAAGVIYVIDPVIEFDMDTKSDRLKAEVGLDELPESAKDETVEFGDELDDALADWDKDPNFALTSNSAGVDSATAQAWVSTLPIAGRVSVVQSVDALPADARNEITKAGVDPARVQAMELNGTIHVIADNVQDLQRVKALVIGHELAHAGQEKKITDLAVDWFQRTANSSSQQAKTAQAVLQRVAQNYGYDLANDQQYRKAVKEATAAIAEQAVEKGWKPGGLMQRLFLYLKHWLRQQGLIKHVSDNELSLAVAEMLRIGEKRLSTGPGDGQFALNNQTTEIKDKLPLSELIKKYENDKSVMWHGTPSGDVRGGISGLHVGTLEAARQALNARIGVPAEGDWDGTRKYGETLIAGKKRLDEIGPYLGSGYNSGAPEENYYPTDKTYRAKYSGGEEVAFDSKPQIFPVRITGDMSNSIYRPKSDMAANSNMKRQLKAGNSKTGAYYINEGEDFGSVSAVVPGPGHINEIQFALQDQAISAHASAINAPAKVLDMVRSLTELAGQSIPERLKANIGKLLSNPWFGSEGKPIRRKVVDLNLERGQNRNSIMSDLFQASEGYTGVEGLDNLLKSASKEERKQFNDLIKAGDLNGEAKIYNRDELYRGKNPVGKVGKTVVEAYKAFHEVMRAANRVRFEQLDALSLLPYKDQEWYGDLIDLLNKNQERSAGLNQQEAADFHRLIRSLKRDLTDKQLETGENPTKLKASPAVIAAYRAFWAQVDQTEKKHQGFMLSAFRDILGYRGEIDKLKNEWGSLKGYAPRIRKDGDWHVSVYATNSEGEREKVYMHPTLTETEAKGHVKEVTADLPKFLKSRFEEGTQYEVEYERNQATPSELLAWKGSEVAVEALLNSAFDKAGVTGKMSVEEWQSLKNEVFQEISKQIMAQGFGRHGIQREKTLIEGYADTDYQTVLKEYISGMSGWLSKMRFAIETTNAAKDISKADPSDKVWVNDYVQDAMKNSTYMDELAATARSVGAVYYLGFKVSSAMLNAFQNYTVGQAELSMMMKKAGNKDSAVMTLARAQKDVMKDFIDRKRGGKGILTQEETDVLHKAVREGTAQAQAVRMISGTQEMGFGTGWKKFTEMSMTPFSFVEQMLNREPGILGAYRAFKTTPAGVFDDAAYKQAEVFVNNTHYVMGKENLPEMVRKLGPLGKTAYLFQGYVHNYLHWMYNRAKDGEFAAIARSLGAVAALGGVFALPGADDLDKWIMKWFGRSYKLEFKKFMRHQTGDSIGGRAIQNFVNHGVTSVVGVDMSRALAVNIPFVSDPDRSFGERMGGAWGGLLKKPGMAMGAAQKGDYLRALENLMPEFAANPMRALRQYDQGATTMSGKPIFDETGRQVKYGTGDVAKKMLGFNPLEVSERTEMKGAERQLQAFWKENRNDLLASIRRAKPGPDMVQAVRDVYTFNKSLRESQAAGLVSPITASTLQKSRSFKPQKKTLMWERNQLD